MKKHPILTTSFLVILIIIFLFITFIGLDIYRYNDFNNKINQKNKISLIGLKGLCQDKNIEYNKEAQILDINLNRIISIGKNYFNDKKTEYQETNLIKDQKSYNELLSSIYEIDNNTKWESFSKYKWDKNITAKNIQNYPENFQPNLIFIPPQFFKICSMISLINETSKKSDKNFDSSKLFNSLLKIDLLAWNTIIGSIYLRNISNLDSLYIFYDGIKADLYSKDEMNNMLIAIKKYFENNPDLKENLKYDYIYWKEYTTFFYSYIPTLSKTYISLFGDPLKLLTQQYELFYKSGNDKDFSQIKKLLNDKPYESILLPNIFDMYEATSKKRIDELSRLAIIQATLEEKLGLEITAKDPYDNNNIRSSKDDKGNIFFYCLGSKGKDFKGKGTNIFNCDTSFKKLLKKNTAPSN